MFIAVFNDVEDIYMINSILRKHKCHHILQRRALTSTKRLFGIWFIKTRKRLFGIWIIKAFLSCVN